MMSPDRVSKRAFLRRIGSLCAITVCAIPTVVADPCSRTRPAIPPRSPSNLHRPDAEAYRRTRDQLHDCSFRPIILPRPRCLSFLPCTSGSETETRPAPARTCCRVSSVRRSRELGAIIVAPDSVRGNWASPENDKAVTALLDTVLDQYAIDKKKIAVTGYSMGGTGSWHLAEKFPERFSAAIPIASRPPASAAAWRLPVLAIHSHQDQVAPFGPVEARIEELAESRRERKDDRAHRRPALRGRPLQRCIAPGDPVAARGVEVGSVVDASRDDGAGVVNTDETETVEQSAKARPR